MPAHQVMILRVYGDDEALVTVRLQSALSEDGMTFGKSVRKSIATAATMVSPDSANAQPSRPVWATAMAATRATTATTNATRDFASPLSAWVQIRKTSARTAVTSPTPSESLRA